MNTDYYNKSIATMLEPQIKITYYRRCPKVERIIYNFKNPNKPATVVFWSDGTKTVVVCREADRFDEEVGIAMCHIKKMYGNRNEFKRLVRKATYQD